MKKLVSKIKNFFRQSKGGRKDYVCFEWSEEENSQYKNFAMEHFEKCGEPAPWLCFRYENGECIKKMVCPVCKTEYTITKATK